MKRKRELFAVISMALSVILLAGCSLPFGEKKEALWKGTMEKVVWDDSVAAASEAASEVTESAVSEATSESEAASATSEAASATSEAESEAEEPTPQTYTATLTQYDISEYPKIKLYLDVVNEAGETVRGLTEKDVVIQSGRGASSELKALTVDKLVMLDKNEGISLGLVADVSGSMAESMGVLKQVMDEFVSSIQFAQDDEVEFVKFGSQAYICNSFTNDAAAIRNSIQQLQPEDRTRLYDTLINEIARIQAQQNAKCIIAFTDGWDNESISTYQDVADYAERCGVPVYLVGIGPDIDVTGLTTIAQRSGGSYQNISDVSALIDIYQGIYQESKELYCLEYTIDAADDFASEVRTKVELEGAAIRLATPVELSFEEKDFFDNLYTRFLIAGEDCQTKGERNLLDSGLIVTSDEAYKNPEAVAYQSEEAIKNGGTGASRSDIYIVLMNHEVIDLQRDGNDYILYGRSQYNISKIVEWGNVREDAERNAIEAAYGRNISSGRKFWLEENRDNYEKIRVVKEGDGEWRIYTRVYERKDGGDAFPCNYVSTVREV